MQELEQAKYEVDVYENHINLIQSLHKVCSNTINWRKISNSQEPKIFMKLENAEKIRAANYKPGFIDKIFKRDEKQRKIYEENILQARTQDQINHDNTVQDWKESVKLAKLLLLGDGDSKIEAINDFSPYSELTKLGPRLSFSCSETSIVEVTIHVHGDTIVPSEIKSLLKSGRLSSKNMPKGKFNELYQDYVCSCVLRVANEFFAIIPDNVVIVTATDDLRNTSTGHLENNPILSLCMSRNTLESFNMNHLDPSDSMSNFVHNMLFKKTTGFTAVASILPGDISECHESANVQLNSDAAKNAAPVN